MLAAAAGKVLETAGAMGGQIAGVMGPVCQVSRMESSFHLEGQIKCQSTFSP